ncbi:MAG: hypothetical protein U0Z53_23685 [Blastocatellia bacterium]
MANENTTPQAGDPSLTTPQPAAPAAAGTHTSTTAQAATTGSEAAETISLEEARKLRSEAKNLRERLRAAEAAEAELKKIKDAELSEAERLKRDIEERDKQATAAAARLRSLQVQMQAQRLGIVDPEAAEKLIDWSKVEDSDEARAAALQELVRARPWLQQTSAPQAPVTPASNPSRSSTSPVTFTKAQLQDRKFWEANRDAIMTAMREGRITD